MLYICLAQSFCGLTLVDPFMDARGKLIHGHKGWTQRVNPFMDARGEPIHGRKGWGPRPIHGRKVRTQGTYGRKVLMVDVVATQDSTTIRTLRP